MRLWNRHARCHVFFVALGFAGLTPTAAAASSGDRIVELFSLPYRLLPRISLGRLSCRTTWPGWVGSLPVLAIELRLEGDGGNKSGGELGIPPTTNALAEHRSRHRMESCMVKTNEAVQFSAASHRARRIRRMQADLDHSSMQSSFSRLWGGALSVHAIAMAKTSFRQPHAEQLQQGSAYMHAMRLIHGRNASKAEPVWVEQLVVACRMYGPP